MIPFNNVKGALSIMLGNANPKLVQRLTEVTDPKPTAGTPNEFRRRNTAAQFEAAGFSGSAELCYNRIDLAAFLGRDGHHIITRQQPKLVYDALPLINRKYRMTLQPDDVVNSLISWDPDSGVGTFILEAKKESLGLIGKVAMEFRPGPDPISELPLNGNLGLALYPSGQNAKGQAQFISYPCDTAAYNGDLSSWRTGDALDITKLEIIRAITGLDWVMTNGDYSLNGAEITYAGDVRPGIDIPKPNFVRLVTIKLGAQCSNFAGELTLYHNPN